jgi:hypothetical protein
MSHRLEKNADTKNIDYKEPETSRSYSTSESDADRERKKQTNAEGQTQDAEAIWDLTRERVPTMLRSEIEVHLLTKRMQA